MTMHSTALPSSRLLVASGLALGLLAAAPVMGQTAVTNGEENFRALPNGVVLGRVGADIALEVTAEDGQWVRVRLQGWVWSRSLQALDRDGFDLVVSAEGGENIRGAPSGEVIGRLEEGMLLIQLEVSTGWRHVEREVWIWKASLDFPGADAAASDDGRTEWVRTGPTGGAILSGPDGDTLAKALPGVDVRIIARDGNWARVRVEGWTWSPDLPTGEGGESSVLTEVSVEEVVSNPGRYRGRAVQWDVQFISLERAEKIRTDFYEGEPFLLTRGGEDGMQFVYVAVPPDMMSLVDGLMPLERVRVVGRLRLGAAALTGSPIIDLMELIRR
ncbi:MAG: hypothetical protein BMS9Abin29_0289 [Gemmatimonadota bacterium]|nr:MAG: hypothetical protein BMS9Abin29_0289 [Gemmatimonadota bacterium]